jgi:hypothetical protein
MSAAAAADPAAPAQAERLRVESGDPVLAAAARTAYEELAPHDELSESPEELVERLEEEGRRARPRS